MSIETQKPPLNFSPGKEPKSVQRLDAIKTVSKEKEEQPFAKAYLSGMLAAASLAAIGGGVVDGIADRREHAVEIDSVHKIVESAREFAESPSTELVDSGDNSWYFRAESDGTITMVAEDVVDRSIDRTFNVETERAATAVALRVNVNEDEKEKTVELTTFEEWPGTAYLAAESVNSQGHPNPPGQFEEHRYNKRFVFGIEEGADTANFDSLTDALSSWRTNLIEAEVYTDDGGWSKIEDANTLSTISKSLFDKSPNNPYGLDYSLDQQMKSEVDYSN